MTTVIASVGIPPTAEPSPGGGGGSKARLDAAHALLGVVAVSSSSATTTATSSEDVADMAIDEEKKDEASPASWEATLLRMKNDPSSTAGLSLPDDEKETKKEDEMPPAPAAKKNKVDDGEEDDRAPCALDALAMLASNAASMDCEAAANATVATMTATTSDDAADDTAWVRPARRERSISNPEGMEKWDSLLMAGRRTDVATIDEEGEDAIMQMEDDECGGGGGSDPERGRSASPLSSALRKDCGSRRKLPLKKRVNFLADAAAASGPEPEESRSKSASSPEEDLDEMLRRARSKLLEDLVTGGGEDGGLVLPHALEKYQDIYNKNGRIGIYDPSERAAIIARFHGKRSRRVWNKRIRYSCRKNLADRRLRVKGRFVKRSDPPAPESPPGLGDADASATAAAKPEADGDASGEGSPPTSPTVASAATAEEAPPEEDMPDTTDVEAGFCPTEDQPYRRTRRHTIT